MKNLFPWPLSQLPKALWIRVRPSTDVLAAGSASQYFEVRRSERGPKIDSGRYLWRYLDGELSVRHEAPLLARPRTPLHATYFILNRRYLIPRRRSFCNCSLAHLVPRSTQTRCCSFTHLHVLVRLGSLTPPNRDHARSPSRRGVFAAPGVCWRSVILPSFFCLQSTSCPFAYVWRGRGAVVLPEHEHHALSRALVVQRRSVTRGQVGLLIVCDIQGALRTPIRSTVRK